MSVGSVGLLEQFKFQNLDFLIIICSAYYVLSFLPTVQVPAVHVVSLIDLSLASGLASCIPSSATLYERAYALRKDTANSFIFEY